MGWLENRRREKARKAAAIRACIEAIEVEDAARTQFFTNPKVVAARAELRKADEALQAQREQARARYEDAVAGPKALLDKATADAEAAMKEVWGAMNNVELTM